MKSVLVICYIGNVSNFLYNNNNYHIAAEENISLKRFAADRKSHKARFFLVNSVPKFIV